MSRSTLEDAALAFSMKFAKWRSRRGLSQKQLAAEMDFDPSYLSHLESGRYRPTEAFARRAESALRSGGEIWKSFEDYRRLAGTSDPTRKKSPAPEFVDRSSTFAGLIILDESATLLYRHGDFTCTVRRTLYNAGSEPVIRYPMRVAVDRFPADTDRSNQYHRKNPISANSLNFSAWADGRMDEQMEWRVTRAESSYIKADILFRGPYSQFPLYPGLRRNITYSYRVSEHIWGPWFQRNIRMPTRRLEMSLAFPTTIQVDVWGIETSWEGERPFRNAISEDVSGGQRTFRWSTENPQLLTEYRLAWSGARWPSVGEVNPSRGNEGPA